MRRTQFLFAFSQYHEVYRKRPFDRDDRLDGVEERALRSLLVRGAARHEDLAEVRFYDVGLERMRLPVLRVHRLHVVHHVDHERALGAGVVVAPDAGVAVGGHDRGLLETECLQIAAQHFGHLLDAVVLGTDGWLAEPALQIGEVLLEVLVDIRVNGVMAAGVCARLSSVELLCGCEAEAFVGELPGR